MRTLHFSEIKHALLLEEFEDTKEMYMYQTDNFKEYDLDTEYRLNIDKYFVCESRDMMSDGSGAYSISFF
jgi:hypothetical protein